MSDEGRTAPAAPSLRLSAREVGWALLALVLAMVARSPILISEPRFWAEDATVHFAYARLHSPLQTLLFVPVDHGPAGYVNLVPNLASLVATRGASLENAPAVFTATAFLVQLLPLLVVLTGRSSLWKRRWEQLLAVALLLLTPAITGEVWLNTVNSQVFCGILAAVLLLEKTAGLGSIRRWGYRCLLALCGLTGIYAATLTPAFLIRHRLRRDRESLVQTLLLAGTAALQLLTIGITYLFFDPQRSRMVWIHWGQRAAGALYHHFFRPIFGETLTHELFTSAGLFRAVGSTYLVTAGRLPEDYLVLAGLVSLATIAGFFLWFRGRSLGEPLAPLLTALFVLELVLVATTGGILAAGRYAVVPAVLVIFLFLLMALRGRGLSRAVAAALVVTALLAGGRGYRQDHPRETLGDRLDNRPDWRAEVAAWRQDETRPLVVWPGSTRNPADQRPERVQWRLLLSRPVDRPRDGAPVVDLEQDLQLVTTQDWELRSYRTGTLPRDFRLTLDLLASRTDAEVDLRLRLEDAAGETLAERSIRGFPAERPFRVRLDRVLDASLLAVDPSRVLRVTFAMRPRRRFPTRVKILRLRIGPRVEGLLDSLL